MNIEKMTKVVLNVLGLDKLKFSKEGDVEFSDTDKGKLGEMFGEDFVEKFSVALTDKGSVKFGDLMESISANNTKKLEDFAKTVNGKIELLNSSIAEANKKVDELAAKNGDLETENKQLKEAVKKLADETEADEPQAVTVGDGKVMKTYKINKNAFHNQMAEDFLKGNAAKAIMTRGMELNFDQERDAKGDSINVSDLKSEFGTYLSQDGFDVLKKLTQPVVSTAYMTTKMAITEWRAAKAEIQSVVQQFVAKWTPLAEATFNPCVVKNYRHKVNLPITPDDINDSWLSFLYDESMTPDQMPITRYIIEELLLPKVDDDRELRLLGKGRYLALNPALINEGDAGQPTGRSMDGFVTIIEDAQSSGTSNMNFYNPADGFNDAGVDSVAWFEDFVKWIKQQNPLIGEKGGYIFCPPEWVERYALKYRDKFPLTKNEDGMNIRVGFSNFTLVGLPSMTGTVCAFHTSKENFIHLKHINQGASKIFLQVENYNVKVFAEWWEGVGFAVEEGVFAYVVAGSGSGSGA